MRIAILSDGLHPYVIGGMQRHTFYLVKYLSGMGVKVTLVHYNQSQMDAGRLEIFTDEERVNIESILLEFPSGKDKLPGHYIRESYQYSCLVYEKIKDRLNEFDFIYTKGFAGWKTIQEKNRNPDQFPPVSVKFHGYEMFQKQADFKSFLQSLMLKGPVKWISRNADYVFSYGSGITDIILKLGVPQNKIIEIPAGIEPSWLRNNSDWIPSPKPRKFVYLGRYERRKGIEELNKAIRQLLSEKEKFEFHFIGPFEDSKQIQSVNIVYHGVVTDNNKIKTILDDSQVLVCPSWSEGMPNVILEGMARGCSVIATKVGATDIMVDHSNGVFAKTGNVEDLTSKMREMIHLDDDKIGQMRNNSIARIKDQLVYPLILDKFVTSITNTIKK